MRFDIAGVAGFLCGGLVAWVWAERGIRNPREGSLRTNVSGKQVPVALGVALAAGALLPLAVVAVAGLSGAGDVRSPRVAAAVAVVIAIMAVAGALDDMRGDESPRGFAGHLKAAGRGRLTGGLLKTWAGGAAGLAAGALVHRADRPLIVLTALAVPLTANFVNLMDRAPGRAGKISLAMALPLMIFGDAGWRNAAAPALGALVAVLPSDLRERGMLGDAGANPLGAVLGLGAAVWLETTALALAVVVLLLLNLASERWSYSAIIERTPPLRWLDAIGRK
ncbi:MAG: hypothetical protein M3273_01960 [Actinomycetota bacterium]|nr:hypothetical protein [Actinomycetota bacterium]